MGYFANKSTPSGNFAPNPVILRCVYFAETYKVFLYKSGDVFRFYLNFVAGYFLGLLFIFWGIVSLLLRILEWLWFKVNNWI